MSKHKKYKEDKELMWDLNEEGRDAILRDPEFRRFFMAEYGIDPAPSLPKKCIDLAFKKLGIK